jgi:feruloyl esterase
MTTKTLLCIILLLLINGVDGNAQNLDNIKDLKLPTATITKIEDHTDYLCVSIISKPTPSSNIGIEIWLPKEKWNERFLGTGNGGGGGKISRGLLSAGIKRGFAVANTDLGTSPNANSVIAYPERWADFGYRATHEMTVISKYIIEKYYQCGPKYSYFIGCSTGGQQALMEAQRFPEDYNGIIAGAPANNRTHLHASFLWNYIATNKEPASHFQPDQLNQITAAVLKTNVGKDGGAPTDNFLTDPRLAVDCGCLDTILSRQQIEVMKKIYAAPINPVTGEKIYTSFPLASENERTGLNLQQSEEAQDLFYPFKWVWGADYDLLSFDFNKDMKRMDRELGPILNANNPDLNPFMKKGGKLIMYTGTYDPLVPFQDAVNYYERVIEKQGNLKKTQTFFRYFLIPGMAHCGGGPGLNDFGQGLPSDIPLDEERDILSALMNWVEKGKAPQKMIVTSYNEGKRDKEIRLRRSVSPYPEFPQYTGGDPTLPSSYKAETHERGKVLKPAYKYLK